jgi:sarcosine oxidase subunit alpha
MSDAPLILVAGGGPAGLVAAATAARLGADVVLCDEQDSLGGQLTYRVQPIALGTETQAMRPADLARRLIAAAEGAGVTAHVGSVVAGVYPGFEVLLANREHSWSITPDALIVATGSTDLPFPFPGATLPGVFSARALQILMHRHRVRPGKRFVILGGGDLAEELEIDILLADGEVVWRGMAPAHLLRAVGTRGVEGFVAGEASHEADVVVVAVGRQPDAALTTMAGIEQGFSTLLGGWTPRVDDSMHCPNSRVFVAGDAAGAGDVYAALLEGQIAGESAAVQLGLTTASNSDARTMAEFLRRHELRASLDYIYAQPQSEGTFNG